MAKTIAFERTWRHTFHANSRSSHCSSGGCAGVGTVIVSRVSSIRSASCGEHAAAHALDVAFARLVGDVLDVEDPDRLLAREDLERVLVEARRQQHLDELLRSRSASAASIRRLKTSTPPNAESGSQAKAFS